MEKSPDLGTVGTVPWALHGFGYWAGLPRRTEYDCRLLFEMTRRVAMVSMAIEPMGSPGRLTISPIGATRVLFSVVADVPPISRMRITGVKVQIIGLRAGTVAIPKKDEATPNRCHSIILGDPTQFTYDRDERLAIRNAVWKVEDEHLSKELTRTTIPGFHTDLLLESDTTSRVPDRVAFEEITRQLSGAMREYSWGYLWNRKGVPSIRDGPLLSMSEQLTDEMYERLHSTTETIERACGVKPFAGGFETGTDVLDAVAYALVAVRCGVSVEEASKAVLAALHRFGAKFDLKKLGNRPNAPAPGSRSTRRSSE